MFRLVAVCDQEPQRLRDFSEQYRCAAYETAEDFVAHPDMELVIIATRSVDHVAHAAQALAAGKLVLLEKPIAVTEADLERLRELDAQYPGKLFFLHNHRFEPAFQHICRILSTGILGTVHTVKLRRHHPFRRRSDWQSLLRYGGGQLNCWGPHIFDHALQLIGAPIKDVWSQLKRINSLGDGDDHVKVLLVGENGVVADVEISDAVALAGAYCTVYGDRGTLVCPDEKQIRLRYIDPQCTLTATPLDPDRPPPPGGKIGETDFPWIEETVDVEPDTNMWVQVEIDTARHMYRALRENVPFPIKNADALEVVRITKLVQRQNDQFDWIG